MSAGDETGCGCCAGRSASTPAAIANRPGLVALDWRVGTHASFKAAMLARISSLPGLRQLMTRDDDDPAIAWIDAWAAVLDVLSFYQERIANEGFLRTAGERRSLRELAGAVGYQPRPGVAASVWLAFTLDEAEGSPSLVTIPAGTRALNVPERDEPPQPFETASELVARPQWNEMRVRTSAPAEPDADGPFFVRGADSGLRAGDPVLVVAEGMARLRRVAAVVADSDAKRSEVSLVTVPGSPAKPASSTPGSLVTATPLAFGRQALTAVSVAALGGRSWLGRDLAALVRSRGWSFAQLQAHVDTPAPFSVAAAPAVSLFALRVTAAGFGHNAPPPYVAPPGDSGPTPVPPPSPDAAHGIDQAFVDGSVAGTHVLARYRDEGLYGGDLDVILLDAVYAGIGPGSWLALAARGKALAVQVEDSDEVTRSDFGISGKVTRLRLRHEGGLADFPLRATTVYAQSELLEAAERPLTTPLAGTEVDLQGMQLELAAGRLLALTGEEEGLAGVALSEIVELASVRHDFDARSTTLYLRRPLARTYRRATVRLNGNVVLATHGESVAETLGSGDASRAFQRFVLREAPLTWTSAPVPGGAASSLQLRVDDVLWQEVADLYRMGPRDRGFTLRRDDDGATSVHFGDGVHGARLPSGSDNVTAVYRKGLGLGGHVAARTITLLETQPLGVVEVTNPLAAAGGGDAETAAEIRGNAASTLLTLDRIVSLDDHESFARGFGGIAKARAAWVWDGSTRVVHVTVAAADGGAVPAGSDLYRNLLAAMRRSSEPFRPLRLDSYDPLIFELELAVVVTPGHRSDLVVEAVRLALREAFAFAARDFAQGVALSEVMAVAQRVSGVEAVDVDALHLGQPGTGPSLMARLAALPARPRPGGGVMPAQHLALTAHGAVVRARSRGAR